jgi:peptidoglycan hydrolase CwlO-like protein
MVVDITVEIEGASKTYTLKDSTEVGYTDTQVISGERSLILKEVESMKNQSEEALKQVDLHKERVDKCNKLIMEFSPELREKKLMDERISSLENSVTELANSIKSLVDEFKK